MAAPGGDPAPAGEIRAPAGRRAHLARAEQEGWRPSRRTRWLIAAVAALALGALVAGLVSEARDTTEPSGVRVFANEGPGLSYGVRNGSGWHCTFSRSDFVCSGGTGRAKSISSARRDQFDVTAQFQAGDELVVVFDAAEWICDLRPVDDRFSCLHQ